MLKKIIHQKGRACITIDPVRVEWIEARGNHSRVITLGGSFMVRQTLEDLEKAWLANKIICISPEIMVNARRIKELRAYSWRGCFVILECGKKWPCEFPYTLPLDQVLLGMHSLGRDN